MKEYTKFGEFARMLRLQHNQVMGDMAMILNVSTSFLSAVETGKKNIPLEWENILIKEYSLGKPEKIELKEAIANSKSQVKLKLTGVDNAKREVALKFARSFDEIDSNTVEMIMKLLEGKKNGL